jgi:hypothetical protein
MASAKQNNPAAREAGTAATITLKVMNASDDKLAPQ